MGEVMKIKNGKGLLPCPFCGSGNINRGYGNGCYVKAVTTIEIDNLVKEMVGENEDSN